MRYPFTLYKKQSKISIMRHACIWDETLQRYAHSRITGVLAAGKLKIAANASHTN